MALFGPSDKELKQNARKEYDKAVAMFSEISEKYTTSEQGRDIDKFINAAKYAKN